MRTALQPLPDVTQGICGFKSSFWPDSVRVGLIPSAKNHVPFCAQQKAVVCFQDLHFYLGKVPETLQHLRVRLTKTEHYARWREYLKRDVVSFEGFHFLPSVRRNAFWEVTNTPFGKSILNKDSFEEGVERPIELSLPFVSDQTVDFKTPKGDLSAAAISSIEQLSRLNGLTGKKMKTKFFSDVPVALQNDARNLLEYCYFCYLSKSQTEFHPSTKEAAFRRLIFITMLAWQQPYADNAQIDNIDSHQQGKPHETNRMWTVGEDAFVRIAPAIAGIADRPTAHNIFKSLIGDNEGLSLSIWDLYLSELVRVRQERVQHKLEESATLGLSSDESVLCVGAKKRQPVQMWNKNSIAWPGRLTLTDKALYFEPNGILQHQKPLKFDLTGGCASVQRMKVGPFGAAVFDSAIKVTSDAESEPWVLEFVDFYGEGRREVWFAFINEILSAYSFIHEYGPTMDDPFLPHMLGSEHGNKKVLSSAVNGIARVQAVQSTLGRALEHPGKLLQFSYSATAPCGDLVFQALAVGFWGGRLDGKHKDLSKMTRVGNGLTTADDAIGAGLHVVDIDGSVFLRRWMKSPTWESSRSSSFWKQKAGGKGLILGKELAIGDLTYLDRAVKVCKEQTQMLEQTKATIDGALLKGIPSNIDLFKELLLPFTLLSMNINKLRRWEDPPLTVLFIATASVILYKNWLKYVCPALLLTGAVLVLILRTLKSQGRLGHGFGRVTIREQPPSNTLQKLLALKEALTEMEIQIQKVNITLLKLRTLALSRHPQATDKVLFALMGSALILLFVPFRYVCAFVLFDQFTCELAFRRGMVLKLERQLKEWWQTIPAAPVVVLPQESHENRDAGNTVSEGDENSPLIKGDVIADIVREWFAENS